jgi:hypothetical protein
MTDNRWSLRSETFAAISAYYIATGLWPLLHMKSFEFITGRKLDRWLVKTVAILVLVIGATLARPGFARRPTGDDAALAAGTALGLTAIDIVYVAKRRIRPVYLLDALLEVALVAALVRPARERVPNRAS